MTDQKNLPTEEEQTLTPSTVIAELIAMLEETQALFRAGRYLDVIERLNYQRNEYLPWHRWPERIRQEIRERENPHYDMREIILERVKKESETYPYAGLDPSHLVRFAVDGDERWDRKQVKEIVQELVDSKQIAYAYRKLWTYEGLKREQESRKKRKERSMSSVFSRGTVKF